MFALRDAYLLSVIYQERKCFEVHRWKLGKLIILFEILLQCRRSYKGTGILTIKNYFSVLVEDVLCLKKTKMQPPSLRTGELQMYYIIVLRYPLHLSWETQLYPPLKASCTLHSIEKVKSGCKSQPTHQTPALFMCHCSLHMVGSRMSSYTFKWILNCWHLTEKLKLTY